MQLRARWSYALVALAAVALFLPTLWFGWAQDDVAIIYENPWVRGTQFFPELLFTSYWPRIGELWRPLASLSFAIDWELSGGNPGWFHATNLLWHLLSCVLVLALLRRLGASEWGALAGALVFAVHPAHVEAVANVVGRSDVAVTACFLAACLVYLSPRLGTRVRVYGAVAFYLIGLGFKESAVTLPAVLLCLDAWLLRREHSDWHKQAVRRAIPMLVLCGVGLFLYLAARRQILGDNFLTYPAPYFITRTGADRVATAFRLIPELLRLLVWPADLSWEWGPAAIPVVTWSDVSAYLGLALALVIVGLTVYGLWHGSLVALGALWVMVTYSPTSHMFFPVGMMIAERILYPISVGLSIAVLGVAEHLRGAEIRTHRAVGALAVLLIGLGAWRSGTRLPDWRSRETLMIATQRDHPEVFRMAYARGQIAQSRGDREEAIREFRTAVELADYWEPALRGLAAELLMAGRYREAEVALRRGVELRPRHETGHLLLASALIMQERDAEAARALAVARPFLTDTASQLHAAHLQALVDDALGNPASALQHRLRAGSDPRQPPSVSQWMHLARLRVLTGDSAGAEAALAQARAMAHPALLDSLRLRPLPSVRAFYVRGFGGDEALLAPVARGPESLAPDSARP